MSGAGSIPGEEIVRGEGGTLLTYTLQVETISAAGVGTTTALNLSVATVDVTLRLRHRVTAAVTTRKKSVGATQYAHVTDGTDGGISFKFTAAESLALPLGEYDVEIVYEDSSASPATKTLHARGAITVRDPSTGTI